MKKIKQLVLSIRPNAIVKESQIQFQKTYNIYDQNEFLGYGYTLKEAWESALKNIQSWQKKKVFRVDINVKENMDRFFEWLKLNYK